MTVLLVGVFLTALVVVNVLYVRHLESKDKRHAVTVDGLLQRIQAPEVAVAQAAALTGVDVPAVDPFDDEAYHEAQQQAMAELARHERMLEEMAR